MSEHDTNTVLRPFTLCCFSFGLQESPSDLTNSKGLSGTCSISMLLHKNFDSAYFLISCS